MFPRTVPLLLLLLLLVPLWLHAAEAEKEPDYVAMAALMIKDGDYFRAADALSKVDTGREGLDRKRFHTLSGLVGLRTENYAAARDHLLAAIEAGEEKPVLQIYLAQAYYGLKAYPKALAAIDSAGEEADKRPGIWMLKASAQWEMGDKQTAWQTLERAAARFPDNPQFQRRQVFALIDLGLYQRAAELGLDYLQRYEAQALDYLAIGKALRAGGQYEKALQFLEQARLRYPDNEDTHLALAHVYMQRQQFLAAARMLEQAALQDPALYTDAAELFRRGKDRFRALYINSLTLDQAKKLKQRLALLLEAERFEQAAMMEPDLYRVGLLEDQNIRYALAYAMFKSGRFDMAEAQMSAITRPDLFRQATQLRQAIQSCEGKRWQCM